MKLRSAVWWLVGCAGASVLFNALQILVQRYLVSPREPGMPLLVGAAWALLPALLVLSLLVACIGCFVGFLLAVFTRRPYAWRLLSASLIHVGAFVTCVRAAADLRTEAMASLAKRSAPLVQALHAYEQKQGHPPKALQELVPGYLAAVLHTGLAAYTNYSLLTGDEATAYEGNPWVRGVEYAFRSPQV